MSLEKRPMGAHGNPREKVSPYNGSRGLHLIATARRTLSGGQVTVLTMVVEAFTSLQLNKRRFRQCFSYGLTGQRNNAVTRGYAVSRSGRDRCNLTL